LPAALHVFIKQITGAPYRRKCSLMNSSGYQPPPVVTYCHCAAEDTWLYFLTYLFLAFYTFLVHCKSAETDRHTHTHREWESYVSWWRTWWVECKISHCGSV